MQRQFALFDGSSDNSATQTSAAQYVGDYAYLSVSWITDTGTASRLTLQGSNDHGFNAAITNWSTVSGISVAGIYNVDAGIRWLRAVRNSNESLCEANMFGTT